MKLFLKLIMLCTALLFSLSASSYAAPDRVRGIYSLMKGMGAVNQAVLKLPSVSGISIRASWEAIEPEEEKYSWKYLDDVLSEAKKAKKKAMLRILPGIHTPSWVYKQGASFMELSDENPNHRTYGQTLRTPVVWDQTYLKKWVQFVSALGKRYSQDATVTLVHIAGPTFNSAEMHLPKRGEGRRLTEKAGYSAGKLLQAWKTVIDAYAEAFPGKALALNISIPLSNDGTMEKIIDYGKARLGNRLCVQGNWLSSHTKVTFPPYRVILNFPSKDAITIGFQMLGAAKNEYRMGPLDAAITKGLEAGAQYFEIYETDIEDPASRVVLGDLNKKLRGE